MAGVAAGLQFSVDRAELTIRSHLSPCAADACASGWMERGCEEGAPVYLAAVLEYLCGEVLELANIAQGEGGAITASHVYQGIECDVELNVRAPLACV